jgi:hypothetical protein
MMAGVVMTGALWVAGDATSKNLGCCVLDSLCCSPAEDCCYGVKSTSTETNGGVGETPTPAKPSCCSSTK